MRRPRGPGGRFLTADEIAAQKTPNCDPPGPSAAIDNDDDMDDTELERDDLLLENPVGQSNPNPHHRDGFIPGRNSDLVNLMNVDFRQISHTPLVAEHTFPSDSNPDRSAPRISSPNTQPLNPTPNPSRNLFAPVHAHRPKGTTNTAPITLRSPYPMHEPHHVRHHHSHANFADDLYATDGTANDSTQVNMQRRTEEMIRRGGTSGS